MSSNVSSIPADAGVKQSDRHYLDEFVRLKCAVDMLMLGLFPNSKEITESFAAYRAVHHHLRQFDLNDPRVIVFCVGDGSTPRTAATFAFRSRWTCMSVDPALNMTRPWCQKINRLHLRPCRTEDMDPVFCEKAVVVAVHSHADLTDSIRFVRATDWLSVVAIPCCVPQKLVFDGKERKPDLEYRDYGIWSPERTVKIWRHV